VPTAGRRLALARGSLASEQGKDIGEHTSLGDQESGIRSQVINAQVPDTLRYHLMPDP
jgi:hypothetical protein